MSVLVIEHEAQCPPGWLGQWLLEAGLRIDVRRPYVGDALPADLDAHRAMVVLGGAMGADDNGKHPWLATVRHLVEVAADRDIPTLGVCLGHQLAAVATGGRVETNPHGQQIGLYEVGWTDAAHGDPLVGAICAGSRRGLHWNGDVVTDLPAEATVLARTAHGEVQAARLAPAVWGVQWHPESGAQIFGSWAHEDRHRLHEHGIEVDGLVGEVAAAEPALRAAWRPLADAFAEMVGPPTPRRRDS